jgi:hypothetical protein
VPVLFLPDHAGVKKGVEAYALLFDELEKLFGIRCITYPVCPAIFKRPPFRGVSTGAFGRGVAGHKRLLEKLLHRFQCRKVALALKGELALFICKVVGSFLDGYVIQPGYMAYGIGV